MAGERTLSVVGEASEPAVPDRCAITFALNVMGPTVGHAVNAVAALAEEVVAALDAGGVGPPDRRTVALSVQEFFDPRQQKVTGRIGSYVLTVEVATERAGPILGALTEVAGDSLQVRAVQLVTSDVRDVLTTARRNAVADARARAEQLAEAAGVRLGAVLSLEEVAPRPAGAIRAFAATAQGPQPPMPIEAGSSPMVCMVRMTFALDD